MKILNLRNNLLKNISFFALFTVPLNNDLLWNQLKFNKIKHNSVTFFDQKIKIDINESASPLIYALPKPERLIDFEVEAKVSDSFPKIPNNKIQGHKGYDDFVLRFGLIIGGDKKLNWLQRISAPTWLLEMEKLLPKNKGVKEVLFFTTCQNKNLLNKTRTHSLSSLLIETCIFELKKSGPFILKRKLDSPTEIIGLWISTDGDETKARYTLEINKILLNYM